MANFPLKKPVAALPDALAELAASLGKLPGIGPRSAERLAMHLVQTDPSEVKHLAHMLTTTRESIRTCEICGALTEPNPCRLCVSTERDASMICVVEKPIDIFALEKAGNFSGRYHVLGGKISPVNGVGPDDLRIAELERRLTRESVRELVIALSTDVEGDATSHYLGQRLGKTVRVTRLAYGLPAGSALEFADELTLARAFSGRRDV